MKKVIPRIFFYAPQAYHGLTVDQKMIVLKVYINRVLPNAFTHPKVQVVEKHSGKVWTVDPYLPDDPA